tara:strand:+ start:10410 stop:10838 length:429 start_codon:yes stop_codon:yes gene_type:complete
LHVPDAIARHPGNIVERKTGADAESSKFVEHETSGTIYGTVSFLFPDSKPYGQICSSFVLGVFAESVEHFQAGFEGSLSLRWRKEWPGSLAGDLLYPLARTGPVVPAHPGDDQEQFEAERDFLKDALCPACPAAMLLRARHS